MKTATLAIATVLGAGYSPFAPGTAGSLAALPLAWLLMTAGPVWYPLAVGLLFVVGVWASGRAEVYYGQKDCGRIVVDEAVGMLITLYHSPATPFYFAAGFFLFRFFDVVKPFPARRIDMRMEGGLGVMLDDVAAAAYALACLYGIRAVLT